MRGKILVAHHGTPASLLRRRSPRSQLTDGRITYSERFIREIDTTMMTNMFEVKDIVERRVDAVRARFMQVDPC